MEMAVDGVKMNIMMASGTSLLPMISQCKAMLGESIDVVL